MTIQRLVVGLVAAAVATGCQGAADTTGPNAQPTVSVTAPQDTLRSIGQSVQLGVVVTDAEGQSVPNPSVAWASSDVGVIVVNSAGLTTAVSNGVATVSATYAGVEDTVSLTVDQTSAALVFTSSPISGVAESSLEPVVVTLLDAGGSAVDEAMDEITIGIGSGPAGATLSGVTAVAPDMGTVTFDLRVDRAGAGYTLTAMADGLPTATSPPFDVLPAAVSLDPPTTTMNSADITWSQSTDPSFAAYVVHRSIGSYGMVPIDTITLQATTSFSDSSVILGQEHQYRVEVETTSGLSALSNPVSIQPGVWIESGVALDALISDPARPMLYGISRSANRLVFLDTNARVVADSIFVGMEPTDLDIDATGDSLFVVSFATDKLYVVDLTARSVARSFSFPIPQNHSQGLYYHVAAGRPGRVYYVDAAWDPHIHVIDTGTSSELGSFAFDGVGNLEVSADGNTIYTWRQYGWNAGSTLSWVNRLDATTDDLSVLQSGSLDVGRDPLDTPILLDASESNVYAKRWAFSTSDLDVIDAAFPDPLYAVTPDGSLAFTERGIYSSATGLLVRDMPLLSRSMVVAPDGSLLFIQEPGTGRVFLYDLTPFFTAS